VRIKRVMTWVLGTALLVACAAPAMAQARPAAPPASTSSTAASDSNGEFGVGYSFFRFFGANAPVGFDANYSKDVSATSRASIAVLGDFSFNHFSGGSSELFDGGLKFGFKGNGTATPYTLFTGGIDHSTGGSKFTLDFGGGVKMPLSGKAFDFFAQVDFPIVFGPPRHAGIRLSVGIAIPLKK
jgi:hypothetical protein